MKILCFIDSLGSGGAQRQLVEIAKCLKENGDEVLFLVYHDEPFYNDVLNNLDIPITLIYEKSFFKRILKIRKYIRQQKIDVVISFLEGANFIAELSAFPFKKWKLIVGERSANHRILKSSKLILYRWFHFLADYIISNSHENMRLVNKCNPLLLKSKQKVIYNLMDFDFWKMESGVQNDSGKTTMVVAASHHYLKNALGMIEAINRLPEDLKRKLLVEWYGGKRGDGSYEEVENLISNYQLQDYIKLYPETKNIKEKMLNSDVVGLFSFHEGLPNVVCEAMMLGKPVMASKVSDIPILIKEESLLFDPNIIDEISKTFEHLICLDSKKLKEIGLKNRDNAVEFFSRGKIVSQLKEIIGNKEMS